MLLFFMEATVKIPDELAARARSRGMRVEDYVAELLAQQLGPQHAGASQVRTPDSLAQFSDKIPALPEIITRDWIYRGHN